MCSIEPQLKEYSSYHEPCLSEHLKEELKKQNLECSSDREPWSSEDEKEGLKKQKLECSYDYEPWSSEDEKEEEHKPEFQRYVKAMVDSQYFYVPDNKPPGIKIDANRPVPNDDMEELANLATSALEWYNNDQSHAKYELHEVLYGTSWMCFVTCITFTAIHLDTGHKETFRARVQDYPGMELEVDYFEKFDPKFHPAAWLESRNATKKI